MVKTYLIKGNELEPYLPNEYVEVILKKELLEKIPFIPLTEAKNIHYGHQNDTLEMAYLRGRTEIIELINNGGKINGKTKI